MKLFPIMAEYGGRIKTKTTDYIPYKVIEKHEEQAMLNHYQTLERLAERGGLSYTEAIAVLEDRLFTPIEQDVAKYKVFGIVANFKET